MKLKVGNTKPVIADSAQVHPQAVLVGEVLIEEGCQVWPGVVIRGYPNRAVIGKGTMVLEGAILTSGKDNDLVVGEGTLISPRAVLSGCNIGSGCLLGKDVVIKDRSVISNDSVVESSTIVDADDFSANTVIGGSPPKEIGPAPPDLLEIIRGKMRSLRERFTEYGLLYILDSEDDK